MNVRLLYIPDQCERDIVYMARGIGHSDTRREEKINDYEGLLRYCLDKGHWSVFDMANVTVEVYAPRNITRQLLRHWSMRFQEYSQRYWKARLGYYMCECRVRGSKNKQGSLSTNNIFLRAYWYLAQKIIFGLSDILYNRSLAFGIAPEVARNVLPEATMTHITVTMSIRTLITYLRVRLDEHTQKEHQHLARLIAEQVRDKLPIIAKIEKW